MEPPPTTGLRGGDMSEVTMNNNIINLMFRGRPNQDRQDFVEFGKDILESEELTDAAYQVFLDMMVDGWNGQIGFNKSEFHVSDVGLMYTVGPYLPCVRRVSFSQHTDLRVDGLPGIRIVGEVNDKATVVSMIRPIDRLPNDIQLIAPSIRKYKYVAVYKSREKKNASTRGTMPHAAAQGDNMDALVLYFGINRDGRVISSYNKRAGRPEMWHAASMLYPAMTINAWADSKYLWIAQTSEDVFKAKRKLTLRLGVSKEHIKSLFYARSLPLTETGRKRPILHWVRAHQRRTKEGIDIDIEPFLRGITELEMDGLRFRITQPDKDGLQMSDPDTVRKAFALYAP